MIVYHGIAFLAGFVLDLLFGDPHWLPHPIRLIGRLISFLEKKLYDETKNLRARGSVLVVLVLLITGVVSGGILYFVYRIQPVAGCVVESIMTYQILAIRSLKVESMKVYDALQTGTIEDARQAVSMIVGRDTACLDEAGVTKAAVETVAENTSDGVIAPMIALAVGGPFFGFLYKAVNTMDSMLGYVEPPYKNIGLIPAKLDDVFNFIPARLSALFLLAAGVLLHLDVKNGWQMFKRDRYKHASPNSAQTESVCAGLLGLRLAGEAWYHGVLHQKDFIGDAKREISPEDIPRACRLMYAAAALALFVFALVKAILIF